MRCESAVYELEKRMPFQELLVAKQEQKGSDVAISNKHESTIHAYILGFLLSAPIPTPRKRPSGRVASSVLGIGPFCCFAKPSPRLGLLSRHDCLVHARSPLPRPFISLTPHSPARAGSSFYFCLVPESRLLLLLSAIPRSHKIWTLIL